MGSRKKKRRGHWCWCCQRRRPNERFTGRGHKLHLCKQCQKLPKTVRAARREQRAAERARDHELAAFFRYWLDEKNLRYAAGERLAEE